jgi:hypothetical protein
LCSSHISFTYYRNVSDISYEYGVCIVGYCGV